MALKVNLSPSTGWTFQKPAVKATPAPKVNVGKAMVNGSGTMSQRDAMQAAMDGAYHNTTMYGAPKGK